MSPERSFETLSPRTGPGVTFPWLLLLAMLLGLVYEAILLLTPILSPFRYPIPYAVPIFDTPFVLVAIGGAYFSLERHRLRQDFHSAALGVSLWLAGLLALAHILAQPDYPGSPGVNPGVAPYFFFLSYLSGFAGLAVATQWGDRQFPLTNRGRFLLGTGVLAFSGLLVIAVLQIRPLLPSLVMRPGRLTLFAIWASGATNGFVGVWALWAGRKKFLGKEQDLFAGPFLLAAFIWLIGLSGFLIFPFRYSIAWYLAGIARPVGVAVVFVGLIREQVWLYREARARHRDLESLHAAGQALITSLDPQQIVNTIAAKALEVSGAGGVVLFQLDPQAQMLRAVSRAGRISEQYLRGLDLPVGAGLGGRAVAERRPVWTSNLQRDPSVLLSPELRERVRREGLKAGMTIPLLVESGQVFGTLSVYYREEREFAQTDAELLSAFGTQVSQALENARAFDQLALRARNDAALRDFSQRLLEATTEETITDEAVRVARELVRADFTSLLLLDPGDGLLHLRAGLGWKPETMGISLPASAESFAGYAFSRKELVQAEDLSRERRFLIPPYLTEHGARAGTAAPLGVREQPIGVVGAYWKTPHRFSGEESRVLQSIAQQTALALEKVRLYVELQANLRTLQETQAQLIQADKLKALGTLLSGMAHELNNPLTSILLSAQLLKQRQDLSDPVRRRMDTVEQECKRASRIIKDLLAFARRQAPERQRLDFNEVINAALALQAPQFDLNKIRVVTDLSPSLPAIWADSNQLTQVFLNLFTNATDAMKSVNGPGGTLTVRTLLRGSEVRAEVDDSGPGISSEHLGRIFDPFFTTKKAGEGTGLGLSLSIGIVEAHGGRMEADNLSGSGARFAVTLPIGEAAEPADAGPVEVPKRAGRAGRILVVDDERMLREILTEVLTAAGHEVETAATGREAIASLERQPSDAIILDLRLPDIDGIEIWRWITSRTPALASRVIFMTGDIMSPETEKFLHGTGRPVLIKPLTMERVHRLIGEVLTVAPAATP